MSEKFGSSKDLAQILKGESNNGCYQSKRGRNSSRSKKQLVMALERVPADIRKQGGVARMSDPKMIKEIIKRLYPYLLWQKLG